MTHMWLRLLMASRLSGETAIEQSDSHLMMTPYFGQVDDLGSLYSAASVSHLFKAPYHMFISCQLQPSKPPKSVSCFWHPPRSSTFMSANVLNQSEKRYERRQRKPWFSKSYELHKLAQSAPCFLLSEFWFRTLGFKFTSIGTLWSSLSEFVPPWLNISVQSWWGCSFSPHMFRPCECLIEGLILSSLVKLV